MEHHHFQWENPRNFDWAFSSSQAVFFFPEGSAHGQLRVTKARTLPAAAVADEAALVLLPQCQTQGCLEHRWRRKIQRTDWYRGELAKNAGISNK